MRRGTSSDSRAAGMSEASRYFEVSSLLPAGDPRTPTKTIRFRSSIGQKRDAEWQKRERHRVKDLPARRLSVGQAKRVKGGIIVNHAPNPANAVNAGLLLAAVQKVRE